MGEPLIRASWAKHAVGVAKRLSKSGELPGAIESISDESRAVVRATSLLAWMPASDFLAFAHDITHNLGREKAVRLWAAALEDALDRSLLKPLMMGAVGIYGRTPGAILRMAPRAWSLVGRDCARMKVELEENGARIRFDDAAHIIATSPVMRDVWQGGIHGVCQYVDGRPTSGWTKTFQDGEAILDVAWET